MNNLNICPQLEAHRACTDPQCTKYHDVHLCELCGVFCVSTQWYDAHLASENHRRQLAGHDGHKYHCTTCGTYMFGQKSWGDHVKGKRHCKNAKDKGVPAEVAPVIPSALPCKLLCGVCDTQIPQALWASHLQSLEHRTKQGYNAVKSALEEALKDKNGVVIPEGGDFGIVESADAERGVSRTLKIQTTVPSSRVTIKRFAITTAVEGAVFTYRHPTSIGVRFSTHYSGHMEDRLVIVFEDTALHVTFVIARTLKAIVGSQANYELLRPIAPFQPRRSRTQLETNVVPGVPPPSSNTIPYIIKLPEAVPPKPLSAALSETPSGKVLNRIRRDFLPNVFNSSTYSRYFKILLWAEEHRMERDLERYDMSDAQLERGGQYYFLNVPGLAEKRPRDRFLVQKRGAAAGHWFEGHVHVVRQESVGLQFHCSFRDWSQQQRYTLQAVKSILLQKPGSAPFVVFGPPGTGKTITIINFLDFTAPSRHFEQIPDELRRYTHRKLVGERFPVLSDIARYRVIVSTCISAFIPYAGQATEPEVMTGIKTMANKETNIILAGDPKQLGPVIQSNIAREFGLERSYLERLMAMEFPNDRFYASELESCGNKKVIRTFEGWSKLPSKRFPIIFHSISGKDDREASSPSFFNIDEVTQVCKYVQLLRDDRKIKVAHNEIGVITPYHSQCVRIRKVLKGAANEVKVGSVEEFQGQERRVIIISTVRSSREFLEFDLKRTLGFVANPRRFNVAVTRAQALLIVIGDPNVLSLDPLWRSFLNYIHLNGGWAGPEPTWNTTETVDESGQYDQHIREDALTNMNDLARRIEDVVHSNTTGNV
ncbi:RNA helicase [Suillus paluster]|uniref:RNA helicase n=1 Tax=Suillus paluster TaxID=48578 RepID=UPI001B87B267|nr:RNA helicase [Suillus paluster]KAG1732660.1 RNA helicase [Suillus paluster]